MIREIDSKLFVDMIISGANNLSNMKNDVDNMNVFPVPDGDTGTNMSMTMQSSVNEINSMRDKGVGSVAKALAGATLRGARGNSGVILSQLIRGLSNALKDKTVCDASLFAKAFLSASRCAYEAVLKPTEGTILTVARKAAEAAEKYAKDTEDIVTLFEIVISEGNKALDDTPNQLPQLKQAGVVDSGGKGLMCILEGALYVLQNGKIIEKKDKDKSAPAVKVTVGVQDIKFKYCTEFLINKASKNVDVFNFKSTIGCVGDSMVVIDDDVIIKVHIHTNEPNIVLGEALKLGELTSIKIENMKIQHENIIIKEEKKETPSEEMKKYGFIAVAAGEGVINTLKELGIDTVIEGGQTMNPSTEDILNSIENKNAENIFVFPNNKNVILSAQQAQNLSDKNIKVIPTKSVMQAMVCMLSYDEDASFEENEEAMLDAMEGVQTGQVTYAVRDTEYEGIKIKKGDILGIVNDKIIMADRDMDSVVLGIIDDMADDDTAVITLFYGTDVNEDDAMKIVSALEEKYSEADVFMHRGDQPVYQYIISVE